MEKESSINDIENKYKRLLQLEPKLVTVTVPSNGKEQKQAFLNGDIELPDHSYPKLQGAKDNLAHIHSTGDALINSTDLNPKHRHVYENFIEGYSKKTRLIHLMDQVKNGPTENDRESARGEFIELNIELYGKPDELTYKSLLQEKLVELENKQLSVSAHGIYDELIELLPTEVTENHEKIERFKPSKETVEWMHGAVDSLYGSMLGHVPEQETFSVKEVRQIFSTIIIEEFGEIAEGWRVDVEEAKAIAVKASEKRIVIPEDRGTLSRDTVRKLVTHEIGVHMLRSITGECGDILPARTGLSDYYDAEEGLGMVMEQSLEGKYKEAGIDHYITAGAAYYDGMDFRKAFEMKWRLKALQDVKTDEEMSDEIISKARDTAYGQVMRMFRGTDELPWFKDLAYYNGAAETWKFLERISGDDFRLTLLMMGKMNTGSDHLRTVLETNSL
jgi:hypothetical protein